LPADDIGFYVRNDLNVEGIPECLYRIVSIWHDNRLYLQSSQGSGYRYYSLLLTVFCFSKVSNSFSSNTTKSPTLVGDFVVLLEKLLDTLEKQKKQLC